MKQVIFNADDLGLSPATNRAIIESFKQGVVRSCSLIVNLPFTKEGVDLARQTNIDVGLHLNLAVGKALTHSKSLSKDGTFHGGYNFLIRYFLGMIKIDDIEREMRAQIELFNGLGFALNHIDSHLHLHCLPKIYDVVLKLAYEYKVKKIRRPYYAPSRFYLIKDLFVLLISRLCRDDAKNVKTVIGLNNVADKLAYCKNDVTELMVHPSYDARIYSKGYYELKELIGETLREKIKEKKLVVVGFGDL